MSSGRARRAARRNASSDLGQRVLVAVPAIVVALVLIHFGDWALLARKVLEEYAEGAE